MDSEAFFILNDDSSEDEMMLQEILPPDKDIIDPERQDKFNSLYISDKDISSEQQ